MRKFNLLLVLICCLVSAVTAVPAMATDQVSGQPPAVRQQQPIKIDINTANVTQLATLPGIGPGIAAAIVAHRQANGNFKSVDDLLDVKGIGQKKLEKIKPYLSML